MEYLQYIKCAESAKENLGFKPYYKWNTFNTFMSKSENAKLVSFKPYYKWNTFNT